MSYAIALDLIVIGFLTATIIFALKLNKKLMHVYQSREELQAFLTQFTASMEKADRSIKDLKGMGESVFKTAQDQLTQATALKDDLTFLNERGDELAERLEANIRDARALQRELTELDRPAQKRAPSSGMGVVNFDEPPEPALVRHLQNVR